MNNFKTHPMLKIISVLLIIMFINFDLSWAYSYSSPKTNNLAIQSPFQMKMMGEFGPEFQRSVFSRREVFTTVMTVAKYLFDEKKEINTVADVIGNQLSALGIPTKEGVAVGRIDLRRIKWRDERVKEVVLVPFSAPGYDKKDRQDTHVIQIARKADISPDGLIGYEWIASDKFAVKILSKDYKELVLAHAIVEKKTQMTAFKPIAKIAADEIKVKSHVFETISGFSKNILADLSYYLTDASMDIIPKAEVLKLLDEIFERENIKVPDVLRIKLALVLKMVFVDPFLHAKEISQKAEVNIKELKGIYSILKQSNYIQELFGKKSRHSTFIKIFRGFIKNKEEYVRKILREELVYPQIVEFHLGVTCNSNCTFCYSHGNRYADRPGKTILGKEKFFKLL